MNECPHRAQSGTGHCVRQPQPLACRVMCLRLSHCCGLATASGALANKREGTLLGDREAKDQRACLSCTAQDPAPGGRPGGIGSEKPILPAASLNAPSGASQEGHPGCSGSPCLSPVNPLAAWPSVSQDGLLPGPDGVHPALPLPCRQPAADEATLLQPLVSPVTPFSTPLALTPLHMVVSFQCPPMRTAASGWPAQPPCRQKSSPFGKEKALLFSCLAGVSVFLTVPRVTALSHPPQNLSHTGLPAPGLFP